MPRKPLPGPSRLSKILRHLQQEPVPTLPSLSSLKLTYALRNDHFGARHFVKDDLPRIAYANPSLKITVDRLAKKIGDTLTPKMDLEFRNGSQHMINMEGKWSNAIFNELLELHTKFGKNIKSKSREGEAARGRTEQSKPIGMGVPKHPTAGSQRSSSNRKHVV